MQDMSLRLPDHQHQQQGLLECPFSPSTTADAERLFLREYAHELLEAPPPRRSSVTDPFSSPRPATAAGGGGGEEGEDEDSADRHEDEGDSVDVPQQLQQQPPPPGPSQSQHGEGGAEEDDAVAVLPLRLSFLRATPRAVYAAVEALPHYDLPRPHMAPPPVLPLSHVTLVGPPRDETAVHAALDGRVYVYGRCVSTYPTLSGKRWGDPVRGCMYGRALYRNIDAEWINA